LSRSISCIRLGGINLQSLAISATLAIRNCYSATSHYVFTDIDAKSGATRKWRGRHLDRKFNAVCDRCNNGWMSDIDNSARDTLKDVVRYRAPVSFLRRGLESIAAFTLKNAFVADYMHNQPFFGTQARRRFKEHRHFPLGVYMWLGGVATERKIKNGLMKSRYGKPAIDSPSGIHTYVFTWSAESLLLQLVATRWTNVLMYNKNGWPNIWQEKRLDNIFIPFWPIMRSRVTWPPQSMISHTNLEMAADRFTTIKLN
jgi:hypothetical protein